MTETMKEFLNSNGYYDDVKSIWQAGFEVHWGHSKIACDRPFSDSYVTFISWYIPLTFYYSF